MASVFFPPRGVAAFGIALACATAAHGTAVGQPVPVASATPSPSSSPSAGGAGAASPAPSLVPSGTPAPAATATASAGTLRLDRASVTVAPNQIAFVGVSGATGAITVQASGPGVTARYDTTTSSVVVRGVGLGNASVDVSDASGAVVTLPVSVLPAAGVVPGEVTIALGGTVSPQFALARVRTAIANLAHLQPGGSVTVRGVTIGAPLHAGDALEASAGVAISAGSAFADQAGTTSVHVRVETLDTLEPAFLLYSDDPERLNVSGDGVLYRGSIDASKPARLYAYHVSDTPNRRLYIALRSAGSASVQILGYAAGPSDAFAYVGHVSTLQYLLERATQESAVVDVSAAAPYVQQLGYRPLGPGDLVAAIFDVRVVSGDPVDVEVIAVSGADDPAQHLADPEHAGDGHGRRGEFSLMSVPPLAFTYALGDAEPAPFSVGFPTIANLRAGGRALGGDYGVLRAVSLQLSNPGLAQQNVYFYEQAAGGTATTTIWFTGDPKPTEIPCIKVAENRYLVRTITLDAGESRTVTGEYMTDGSSSFPLDFGLTMDQPSPPPGPYSPDACNPKTPPATPTPVASPPLPEPSASPLASPSP